MEHLVVESLITSAGGAGVIVFCAVLLLRKVLSDLSERIARAEDDVRSSRDFVNDRMEKRDLEYRKIIDALNEIKMHTARLETLVDERRRFTSDFVRDFVSEE